ncbi:hypothetical protein QO239_23845 [Cupriavidus taiwanensis]|uniref:hypothetical protein n=1 Tax=Cupriavidus taiwanensis TaxID=164546 RepID=UPI0025407F5A|nr:hypothetical protein [Cupriavidus taiwanensis]MDK3025632.1 hypothetical protein [Cupriavidus taiwanensis]
MAQALSRFFPSLAGAYCPETYVHYGADGSKSMHSWQHVVWRGNSQPSKMRLDDGNGSYRKTAMGDAPTLTVAPGKGDGTVSAYSGEAPRDAGALAGVKASFRHGSDGSGAANVARKGYDHQGSYNDPRSQWASLFGIIKIAQLANWHPSEPS